jgi:signal transduction histidine kinase
MQKYNSAKFVLSLLFLLLFAQNTFSEDRVKNIVVFFSYNSGIPGYQKVLEELKKTFDERKGTPVNIIVEYLDIGRSDNEEYPWFIIDLYKKKIKETKIDLVIIAGPEINPLLLKYGGNLLHSVPVINIDIADPGRTTLKDLNVENGIDIVLKFKISNTLRQAFALCPDHKNVFVINGHSKLDSFFEALVKNSENEFGPDYHFKYITGLTMDSTIQAVKNIPPKSIIMFGSFLQDADKVFFTSPEVINILSDISPVPVFSLTLENEKKENVIGGYLFSYTAFGKELGRISNEVLRGSRIDKITVDTGSFYQQIYDWHELEKWNMQNSSAIPKNAIFYNKEVSFFILYKWYLLGLLIFLLLQSFLILHLIRLNRRQKAISYRMMVTESMHRNLIRTDRLSNMATLTASLSHELFQPLSAIRYTAQAAKRMIRSGKLDPEQASLLFENILEDDMRATGIINSVKSLMKMETPEKSDVDVNALVHETVDIIRSDAINNRIKIILKLDNGPVFIFGDKVQLQQVLMNFIKNATAAMENTPPENRIMEVNLKIKKDSVIVSVLDSGPGIDGCIQEKLFNAFVTTKKDGFGIGLTLCKSLIENHNGKIWAENIPEGGSQFSFSLPVIKNKKVI